MGVPHLSKLLKKYMPWIHVSLLKGSVAAVDISCWIHAVLRHKSLIAMPLHTLALMMMERCNILLEAGITPVVVFDGVKLPAKSVSLAYRCARNHDLLKRAEECDLKNDPEEAAKLRAQAKTRTPEFQAEIINVLKTHNIAHVVAPYEADAQIVLLVDSGLANLVVTVDSDLALYGCKRILFQLNKDGFGYMYQQEETLPLVLGAGFDLRRFRWCCILIGCDYFFRGVVGIGIVRAQQIYKDTEGITDVITFIIYVQSLKDLNLSPSFSEDFLRAELTYLHQVVVNVTTKEFVHLNPLLDGINSTDISFAGSLFPCDKISMDVSCLSAKAPPLGPILNLFHCKKCDIKFNKYGEKRDHWKQVHSPTPKTYALNKQAFVLHQKKISDKKSVQRKFKCPNCDMCFPTYKAVYNHHSVVHMKEKSYKCSVCSKGFKSATKLSEHLPVHGLQKQQFPCNHCNKVYTYRAQLRTHLLMVKNVRVHKCDKCDKSFVLAAHLRQHMKTHQPNRVRFHCDMCPASFSTKPDLTVHFNANHTNRPLLECEICRETGICKRYKLAKGLRNHKKNCHNM